MKSDWLFCKTNLDKAPIYFTGTAGITAGCDRFPAILFSPSKSGIQHAVNRLMYW